MEQIKYAEERRVELMEHQISKLVDPGVLETHIYIKTKLKSERISYLADVL